MSKGGNYRYILCRDTELKNSEVQMKSIIPFKLKGWDFFKFLNTFQIFFWILKFDFLLCGFIIIYGYPKVALALKIYMYIYTLVLKHVLIGK